MSHDAMNDSDRSSPSGREPADERKPFVKPELRRETGLVDGTANTFSNMN